MSVSDPVAALIAGLTTNGIDHGVSKNFAVHLLEVLDDAHIAVVPLLDQDDQLRSTEGVSSVRFGPVTASVYPVMNEGVWVISAMNGSATWYDASEVPDTAAGLLAALRWVQQQEVKQ